jgi:hypothetical protein
MRCGAIESNEGSKALSQRGKRIEYWSLSYNSQNVQYDYYEESPTTGGIPLPPYCLSCGAVSSRVGSRNSQGGIGGLNPRLL